MNKSYNLIIVDDESLVTGSISAMDEWAGKHIQVVGTAKNGVEALDLIKREHVDIVITDIQMPDMDGLELLQAIYTLKPDIAVIIISGYEQFNYAFTAMKYKAKGYVLKPIDTDELFALIDDIINEKEELAGRQTPAPAANTENAMEDAEQSPKSYHELLVEQAISHLTENLGNPPTLNEMANHTCLTPHYFGQIFKAVTNEYYTVFLTKLRMEEAKKLLQNPELKNYEISRRIGYKDVKYFTKVFHRMHRITPKEYRKRYFEKAKSN